MTHSLGSISDVTTIMRLKQVKTTNLCSGENKKNLINILIMFKYFFFSTYYLFGWLILCTCCWTHDMFGFINLTVLRDGVSVMNNKMIEAFL